MRGPAGRRPRTRRLIGAAGCLALGVAVLLAWAPRSDILTTTRIDAPPAAVWSVLTATADYPDWNPMIARMTGRLAVGGTIEVTEGRGADRMTFRPRILVADAGRELRWRGRLWGLPGLLTGEHEFLLRPMAQGTLFSQGEHFSGVLLWAFDTRDLVPMFEAMNVALAIRAERFH